MARDSDNTREMPLPPMPTRFTAKRMGIAVVLVVVYWGCVQTTGFSPAAIAEGMPALWDMGGHMIPPDTEDLPKLGKPFLETLYIGVLATIIGSMLAIPVGFLAAANMSHPIVYYPVRMVLTVFRAVSEIIWALLFVVAVGLGPMAGILALIVFAVGVQSKLVAEAVEAVEPGPLEAMRATGAPPLESISVRRLAPGAAALLELRAVFLGSQHPPSHHPRLRRGGGTRPATHLGHQRLRV